MRIPTSSTIAHRAWPPPWPPTWTRNRHPSELQRGTVRKRICEPTVGRTRESMWTLPELRFFQGTRHIPLTTRCRRSCVHNRLAFPETLLEQIKNHFIVYDGVCVVHPHWVGSIVKNDRSMGDPFSKVRLRNGIRTCRFNSPEHTLKQSTPRSKRADNLLQYHLRAAGLVTSTTAKPTRYC
jgi:hypothetical protein